MNREQFLARVGDAAAAGRAYRVHIDPHLPEHVGYAGGGDDLPAKLAAEITGVGGQAIVVDDLDTARAELVALLEKYQPRQALCWDHPLLDRLGLTQILAERGIASDDHAVLAALTPQERRERIVAADIGITSASYAIAETGSLAMLAGPGRDRMASLLPPIHIAIIERAQILPDLFDLFTRLKDAGYDNLPSNLAFITGPSKTGDIEMTLTTGVHGPGVWHVIVVR